MVTYTLLELLAEVGTGAEGIRVVVNARATVTRERIRDAERTRREILEAARTEFARVGYSGSRVDDLARLTNTTKRMIYYYFGSKEGLYIAVLESAYGAVRDSEHAMELDHLAPVEALRALSEATFDSHDHNPDFVRLVSVENIHKAEHIKRSTQLRGVNSPILDVIADILERGQAEGSIRSDVTPIEVHTMMSALCFYRVANRFSIKSVFGYDMSSRKVRARQRQIIADVMEAWLTTPEPSGPASPETSP